MKVPSVLVSILLVTGVLLAGCSKEPPPMTAGTPRSIDLQQEWFPFSGFAGEVAGAKRFAAKNDIELKILPGSEQIDPIKLVLAGTTQFGVVGGDLLVSAVAKGAPLVAIGVVNERTPTVFIVDKNSNIHGPKDFPGHTIGVLSGTNTERVYELMMKRASIDRKTLKEVQIPFDLQTFLLKQYDVRPAFAYDEPVSLEQQGFAYRVIKPSESGVAFPGTVYFTTRDALKTRRADAVRLMTTLIEGWRFALADPAGAISDLHERFPAIDSKRELRALQLGADYFRGPNGFPLQCDPAVWREMIKGLEELNAIPANSVSVDQVWDPSVLQDAYKVLDSKGRP